MAAVGTSRRNALAQAAGAACLLACSVASAQAQRGQFHGRPGVYTTRPAENHARPTNGQHLPQWLAQHQNLSPAEQENALRAERGFSRLSSDQQQALISRLHRFDMESPAQRQRVSEWNERFMALPPERQQEIRGASQSLAQMPSDRRQAVREAFRDLRTMPPDQRQQALGSARFQAEYTPQERTVLGNLLSIEPYEAPH